MTKLVLVKVVADRDALGMWLPWYWGFAYRDYDWRMVHFAIVPLNWIIGLWVRWVQPFLQRGYRDRQIEAAIDRASHDAYLNGYREGERAGADRVEAGVQAKIRAFIEEQTAKRNI